MKLMMVRSNMFVYMFILAVLSVSLVFSESVSEIHNGIVIEKTVSYQSKIGFDTIKGMKTTMYTTTVTYKIINDNIPKRFIRIKDPSEVVQIAEDVTPSPIYDSVWKIEDVGPLEENIIQYTVKKKVELNDLDNLGVSFENKNIFVNIPENVTVGSNVFILVTDEDNEPVENIEVEIVHGSSKETLNTDNNGTVTFTPKDLGKYTVKVGNVEEEFEVYPAKEVELKTATITIPDDKESKSDDLPVIIGLVLFAVLIGVLVVFIVQSKFINDDEAHGKDNDSGAVKQADTRYDDSINIENVEDDSIQSDSFDIPEDDKNSENVIEQYKMDIEEDESAESEERGEKSIYFIPPDVDIENENAEASEVQDMKRLIQKIKKNRAKIKEIIESRHSGLSSPPESPDNDVDETLSKKENNIPVLKIKPKPKLKPMTLSKPKKSKKAAKQKQAKTTKTKTKKTKAKSNQKLVSKSKSKSKPKPRVKPKLNPKPKKPVKKKVITKSSKKKTLKTRTQSKARTRKRKQK
ncbi:carboxypeptidase regulatory-like domain-containing protein [Candidatus Micrarchaeota archaeon]|nr:carboxypeptidase regulatory-like domain-containing protein [Candidatus Micrarchaeota archaeon]